MTFDSFDFKKVPKFPINKGAQFISGYAFKSSDFCELGVPVVKIKNIQNKTANLTNSQCVPNNLISKNIEKFILTNGDILIAMTGQGSVGRVGRLLCPINARSLMNQRVGKFIADEVNLNKDYLYYVISSSKYEKLFFDLGSGSGQPNLSPTTILSVEIPFPEYHQQCAISEIFNSLDDQITLLHETNSTLEAIAQTLFKSWFVDFDPVRAKSEGKLPEGIDETTAALFPDSFEQSKLGEIPKGWKISNIGSELTTILGGTPSRERREFWNDGVVSWINSGKVNEFRITTASELITEEALLKSATKLLPARTTVIAITGATLGQVSIVEIEACTNQSVVGLIQNEKFSTEYIYFWINFNIKKLISSQTGGAQQHINKGNVEDLHFLVPDIKILNEFKSISHPLFLKVAENCFQINTLGNIRDTLLPPLISGQLGLSDLDEINNKIKVNA